MIRWGEVIAEVEVLRGRAHRVPPVLIDRPGAHWGVVAHLL